MLDDSTVTNFIDESEYVMLLNTPVVSNDNVMNDPKFEFIIFLTTQSSKFKLEDTIDRTVSSEVISLMELLVTIISDK